MLCFIYIHFSHCVLISISGAAGGPGTIFFEQTGSPGIGKLIIDNFAKNPNVYKPSSTSEEFDVLTQGKLDSVPASIASRKHAYIILTPFKAHFYIVKLRFTRRF